MKIYFMVALCIVTLATACHTAKPTAGNTAAAGKLLGKHPVASLEKPPYNEWYRQQYDAYVPDSGTVAALRPLLAKKKVAIFLGTWCGDSRREVPRMIKVLQAAGFSEQQLELVMVDNAADAYKQSPGHEEAGLNIFRVPTFIVTEKGAEKGRIIESPVGSLEKDLLLILRGAPYTPRYPAGQTFLQQVKARPDATTAELAAGLQPLNRSELNSIAYMFLAAGQSREAMLSFRINALLYPDDAAVFGSLAAASLMLKDTAAAREHLQRALQLDPKNEAALKVQGRLAK